MIIISYNKQTWNEYNDSQTADENLANGAIISADRLNHIENGISSNDTEKVTDNKDGTEQLNGVQVQPFNKLSDSLGGRNLLLNTQKMTGYDFIYNGNNVTATIEDFDANTKMVHVVADKQDGQNVGIYAFQGQLPIEVGDYWTLSFDIKGMGVRSSMYIENSDITVSATDITADWTRKVVKGKKVTAGGALVFYFDASKSAVDVYIKLIKIEHGTMATDWTPAPEDVTTAVSAKQDKLSYTPADDSKVVHTADTSDWQKQAMFNPGDYKIDTTSPTTDFATLLRSKYNKAGVVYIRESNGPSYAQIIDAVVICEGDSWWYAYGVTWDGNFVHRRVRESDDTGWIIDADDSKVAHLSGANNFDTVPTYGNNEIPLALNNSGSTTNRPTGQVVGYQYFDTTLNKPIWYNGSNWVDSTGATV